jgi:protocatechuate 3,4-dioxygenase beta subunit
MKLAWLLLFALAAAGQTPSPDQTGSVTGVVTDAVTHVPVKKTAVTAYPNGNFNGRNAGPQATTTDAGGAFTIANMPAGKYRLMFQHQNYPQARFGGVIKTVEIKAGESAGPVNAELTPGASVSGHVVDEDGDPIPNCSVQVHPPKNPDQGVPMTGSSQSNVDGEYRAFGIAPGKYLLSAQCGQQVFQPHPFSAAPDAPTSRAYATQYYPLTSEVKSAQMVELTPGNEKSGVDFQMSPAVVTQVHGIFAPGGADWHGGQLNIQLTSLDQRGVNLGAGPNMDKGTFEFRQVFPGSYMLAAYSQGPEESRIGAWQRVEVSDRPVELALELKHAIELSGKVEIESSGNTVNKVTPAQIQVVLNPQNQFAMPSSQAHVSDDGTFTMKNVLPAPWHLQVNAPFAFLKAAWLGSTDVTNAPLDLSAGAVGPLRIIVSTNTATIRGSAPAGLMVMAQRVDEDSRFRGNMATGVDQNGQYNLGGLAPGKYRLMAAENGGPMSDDDGQEVTVREGETVTVDLKATSNP